MSGWICLWRNVRDKKFYREKPFCEFKAWCDVLLEANWAEKKDKFGELVPRGSFNTSQQKLAKRWGWSRSKVQRFLDKLETEQRIEQLTGQLRTQIRVTNYEQYQQVALASEHPLPSKPNRCPDNGAGTTEQLLTNKQEREEAEPAREPDGIEISKAIAGLGAEFGESCARHYTQIVLSHCRSKRTWPADFTERTRRWILEDQACARGWFKQTDKSQKSQTVRPRPELQIFRADAADKNILKKTKLEPKGMK